MRQLITVLALSTLASSCVGAPRGGPESTYQGREGSQELTALHSDPSLEDDLEIVALRPERIDGRLHVQFELHNKRPANLPVEWTVQWFDSNGFLLDSTQNWRPLAIGGRGFVPIQMTAPRAEATSWRLAFRAPNTVR